MLQVRRDTDGPDIQQLKLLLQHERPVLFIMQSVGHNPTGSDISAEKAHTLLELAARYNFMLVENDAMGDFKLNSCVKLSALDQLKRTLYVGSFSKPVSAALRVGFIAGDKGLVSELADIKMLMHVSGAEYAERTVEVILREGNYLRHIAKLQQRLRDATNTGLRVLDELGADLFCRPEQSLYLWAKFPGIKDANELTQRCIKHDVILAPGSIFYVNHLDPVPWTRLNVAYLEDPNFRTSLTEILRT